MKKRIEDKSVGRGYSGNDEEFYMRGRNRRSRIMIIVMHYQMICTKGVWRIRKTTMDEVGNHRLLPSMAL